MSLKAFHLIFISASTALALGFGIWELKNHGSTGGEPSNLALGLGSFLVALGLILYECYFLRITKHLPSL
jgi:hypothetical protein